MVHSEKTKTTPERNPARYGHIQNRWKATFPTPVRFKYHPTQGYSNDQRSNVEKREIEQESVFVILLFTAILGFQIQ